MMATATKVSEHIEWMEANKASVQTTAEHFGITRVELHRKLILSGYQPEEWFRWSDESKSSLVNTRPYMYSK